MYVNYEYYRIFYYVAKYQSFTKAAKALLNSQPNITRAVKNLERELGCTLFSRSSRSVSLTQEGQRLYAHVSIAVEHIQAGERELALDKGLQSGTIAIGASEVALHVLLLPILRQFRRSHPGIHIQVANHSTPQAMDALRNGLIDLAVVTTPVDLTRGMEQTILKTFRETPVCGAAFSGLAGQVQTLRTLMEYPVISLGSHTKTYEFYSRWFQEQGLTFTPDIEAATADQILPMVQNDLGIGFVPEDFLPEDPVGSGLFRISLKEEIPVRSVCMVKQKDRSLSIAAGEMEHMIRDCRLSS